MRGVIREWGYHNHENMFFIPAGWGFVLKKAYSNILVPIPRKNLSEKQLIELAVDENSDNIIFGECKYTTAPMDTNVYYDLLEKIKKVNWHKEKRKEHFVFFSINGYTDKMKALAREKGDIVLY